MNNFGRVAEIQMGTNSFSSKEFTIEFTVPFDNDLLPNESEIKIYNLSTSTIATIKPGETLILNAGYEGDTGMILHGYISKVKTTWSGVDKLTTIHVMDSDDLSKRTLQDITYAEGTLASVILQDMASQLGLPVALFALKQDVMYEGGYTATGEVTEIIKKITADCETSAYINKNRLYIRNLRDGSDDDVFELSQDTGLIGRPEPFEEEDFSGMSLKSQLQHRITTASVVRLISREKEATLHIRNGSHKMSGTDFVTEMEGIYP